MTWTVADQPWHARELPCCEFAHPLGRAMSSRCGKDKATRVSPRGGYRESGEPGRTTALGALAVWACAPESSSQTAR